ncbi:MAG TPA: hypothetical protein VF235_06950 [Actinomycetota bacterium]
MARFRFVMLVVVVTTVLAACGGDSSSEPVATGPTGATAGDTGGATGPTGTTGVDPNVFDSAECAEAIAAWTAASNATMEVGTGSSSDLDQTIAELQAFAEAAPDEISDDLTTVYTAYGAYLRAMEDSGYDPSSGQAPTADQLAAITAAAEALSSTDVTDASQRVSDWFSSNCGGA